MAVCTPGRLCDILLRRPELNLTDVSTLILDEVDVLLSRDFREPILQLCAALPSPQTLLFSATITNDTRHIAREVMHLRREDPIPIISVDTPPTSSVLSSVSSRVREHFVWVEEASKKRKLFEMLWIEKYWKPPIIVFVNSKVGANYLSQAIASKCDIVCHCFHGALPQQTRLSVMKQFREGDFPVLVATNLMGRGIDIPAVNMVCLHRNLQLHLLDIPSLHRPENHHHHVHP